jgi:hypothetical protein
MPMVVRHTWLPKARIWRIHRMGVVEAHDPVAVGIVQRQRIAKPMRARWRLLTTPDFEFQPIALLQMVDAAIEREQEF